MNTNDIVTTDGSPSQMSTIIPEIISTKLKKTKNFNDSEISANNKKSNQTETMEIKENGIENQTISSNIEVNTVGYENDDSDDDDVEQMNNQSTLKYLVTEPTETKHIENISTTKSSLETENFDHPPNFRLSTTEQLTVNTSESIDEHLTPTASLLKSESLSDFSFESYEDSTTTRNENLRKLTNFSEKFESFAESMKNTEDSAIATKKVMILERPVISNIQKIARSKPKTVVKTKMTTEHLTTTEHQDDENNAREDEGLVGKYK